MPFTYDVVIHRTSAIYDRTHLIAAYPPVRDPIDIGGNMSVRRLEHGVADRVARTVSAGGVPNAAQHQYAFVREHNPANDGDFDPGQRLQAAIALSRLVCPTSIGLEESCQIEGGIENGDAGGYIRPGPVSGPAAQAWIANETARDWLTADDALALRELIRRYDVSPPVGRIKRALWYHEYAARTLEGSVRWIIVATGLEALLGTDRIGVSKQFVERTVAIAQLLNVEFSRQDSRDSYSLRSKMSHGAFTSIAPERLALYVRMETLLRMAIKQCIELDDWRAKFQDDASVRAALPVSLNDICPKCGREIPLTEA